MEPLNSLPGKRVLIAEDSVTIRGYLRRTVHELFASPLVHEVGDGQGALALVESSPPDLLITDLHMPIMSGRDFLREAFRRGRLEAIPILVLSSTITLDLRDEFSARPGLFFLRKPATAADIRQALAGAWQGPELGNISLAGK